MDLSGQWRALVAHDELRRTWLESDDRGDEAWEPITVPGHWRSTSAFADTDGPLLYRTHFEHERPPPTERSWLVLDGLFYQGDVWLDGTYVGDTEGYFFAHDFEVTEALAGRPEHTLGIEATCSRPTDRTAKRNITGAFQHSDLLDPDWNPGGLWRPVRIEQTGPVRIRHLRVRCRDADEARAVVSFWAVLDASATGEYVVRSTVGSVDHVDERTLAAGENHVEWTVTVADPQLWWPHALGAQPLVDAAVEVALADGAVSHRQERRIGLRRVVMRNWIMAVNGERLFLKGSNAGPTRMALAEATPDEVRADVSLAKDAGLDLLRVHTHIARPELYDAADEAGLLLWQDLPLHRGYARGIRKQAMRQARSAVDLLAHHPSVVVWCGHNEPVALDRDDATGASPPRLRRRFIVGQELPSWNKTVLDRSVKRTLEQADGTRPVIAHSGVLPHPPQLDGTDSHLWFGWHHGQERDLAGFARSFPRMVRFVSELGAQAVPETAGFCRPERWPHLDWTTLGRAHGLQKAPFDRYVPPGDHETFDSWRAATQRYQATVIRHHIETLRRLKYRPTGGFAQFCFADAHPAVTWSVLGHDRLPKPGYAALRAACRPVIVVADRMPAEVRPSDALSLDVHVVSDLRVPLPGAVVDASLSWDGGSYRWRWGGDIPVDCCQRVATLQFAVPDASGPLRLDLTLETDGQRTASSYESHILGPS